MNIEYCWLKIYHAALLETDWSRIEERIQEADEGIRARLHEFSLNHGGTPEENQAIDDALNALSVLRKEVAAWQNQDVQASSLSEPSEDDRESYPTALTVWGKRKKSRTLRRLNLLASGSQCRSFVSSL